MTTAISAPIDLEQQLALQIRRACEAEIARRDLQTDDLAKLLDLLPLGVDICFARSWELEKAIRIADVLGLTINIAIESEAARYERRLEIGSRSRPSGLAARGVAEGPR